MLKKLSLLLVSLTFLSACTSTNSSQPTPQSSIASQLNQTTAPITSASPQPTSISTPVEKAIPLKKQIFQTFNNCGPATFSMLLSYYGFDVSQQELGNKLRPYQVPNGDNDDKSVTLDELVEEAKNYNLTAYYRPAGNKELLKQFIANDIPVVLRTWLNDKDDIGHFIVVRGYSDTEQVVISDDSYYGKNRKTSYETLMKRWQPFGYEFMVVATPNQVPMVKSILRINFDQNTAWKNAITLALQENQQLPTSPYPPFNASIAYYRIGDYTNSVKTFEEVETHLPRRMLWYQIQPIEAYQKLKNYDRVFQLTDAILNDHNHAFSELYYLRAQAYLDQNKRDSALNELQLAIKYNQNYAAAKELYQKISQ